MTDDSDDKDTTRIETLAIGTVEKMDARIGKVETINQYYGAPPPPQKQINKIVPLSEEEGGLSKKQKDHFADLINKAAELGEISGNPAKHSHVRMSINDAGGVTSVHRFPAHKFKDGIEAANRWIGPRLIHEKVIENPPEWWKSHLCKAIHAALSTNGTEDAFREWLHVVYGVETMDHLTDAGLADAYKKRNNKFANPKAPENPRDFELRVAALMHFLDRAEALGHFNRMNIPMERKELFEALQANNHQLFAISEKTFETFLKQAKKQVSFCFKRGVRSATRTKPK